MRLAAPTVRVTLRSLARPLALLAVSLGAAVLLHPALAAPRKAAGGGEGSMPGMNMSWFASHPRVGAMAATVLPPAATFTVQNYRFDLDANAATQVDTARILVGQVVAWSWINGVHTITNGTGDGDPNAGLLFDQPSQTGFTTFSYQFNTPGTYPFYCRYHGALFNMTGVIIVTAPVPTQKTSWGAVKRRYAH